MRVAVLGPTHPFKGGVSQHTTVLAQRLAAAGHEVQLVSWLRQYPQRLYPGQQTVAEQEFDTFEPTLRALSWDRPWSWVGQARRLARECDLVVVAHVTPVQVPAYLTMARILRRRGCPVVVVAHNVLPHETSAVDRRLVRMLFDAVARVVVHSEREAATAREITRTPLVVAPIAPFMPPGFARGRPDPGEHRRVLFFGLVRPYKGLDVLLRAVAAGPPDLRLRVVGEFWGGTTATERLAADLGITDRVELRPGYLAASDVPQVFRDVDALVLPYRSATGSQAVWTGFEFGVPVIATRAGRLAEDVRDGVDGLVVEPHDEVSLAHALSGLYAGGAAERMRADVRPVDPAPHWARYLDRLLAGLPGS